MPHFIAIHRFNSDATRKVYCSENGEPMTQKAWAEFANNTKDNVKCRQEFVGDDIAFCHWEADSKETVLAWIEEMGLDALISTELHEQWRFTSFYNQSDALRVYKEFD
tara:strand:+ start:254 stop:577 length:324 start_codon:yes stop_codon:yes gene_type:complete